MNIRFLMILGLGAALVVWLGAIACEKKSASPVDGDNGSDSDGDADGDADGDGDADADDDNDDDSGFEDDDNSGDDDDDTSSDSICEEEVIDITPILSRVMVLQDISGSMVTDTDENPVEKWNQAKAAITKLAEKYDKDVDLGLDFFPDGSDNFFSCGVENPVISDTAPANAQKIIDSLNAAAPDGNTPLYLAMKKFTEANYAPQFTSPGANSYLLVVSDGADTCGMQGDGFLDVTPEVLKTITTTLLNEHKISTFVIGFGEGVEPDQLNAIAANGGTEFTEYLVATDQQSLEDALETVITTLVSCTYQLTVDHPNVDPKKVNFYFVSLDDNGDEVKELIPFDEDCKAGKGWRWADFSKFIVEFCEEACAKLQTGDVVKIIAEFGCDVIPV